MFVFIKQKFLLLTPLLIHLALIIYISIFIGDSFFQFTDGSFFLTLEEAKRQYGYLWTESQLGNTAINEVLNFYPRTISYFGLQILPVKYVQLVFYFIVWNAIFYSSWYFISEILKLYHRSHAIQSSFIASFFYCYNLLFTQYWAGGVADQLFLLLMSIPYLLYVALRFLETGILTKKDVIVSSLAIGLNLHLIPFNLAFYLPVLVSIILTKFVIARQAFSKRNILQVLAICAMSILVGSVFLIPLAVFFMYPDPFSLPTSNPGYLFSRLGFNGFFSFMFNWSTAIKRENVYAFALYPYFSHIFVRFAAFFIWIFSILSSYKLLAHSKYRKGLYFLWFIIVLSLLMAKGINNPFSSVNSILYEHVPFLSIFRTPDTKFGLSIVTALAVLLAFSLSLLKGWKKVLLIFSIGVQTIIFFIYPTIFGSSAAQKIVSFSEQQLQVSQFINSHSRSQSVLFVPGRMLTKFSNNYYNQDLLGKRLAAPPIYTEDVRLRTKTKEQLQRTIPYFATTDLGLFGIEYLVIRSDIERNSDELFDKTQPILEQASYTSSKSDYLEEAFKTEDYQVYRVKSPLPVVQAYTHSDEKIGSVTKNNPTNYEIKFTTEEIEKLKNGGRITFLQSYHRFWELSGDGNFTYTSHELYNEFANQWRMSYRSSTSSPELTIELNFVMQDWYYFFGWVSVVSILCLIFSSVYLQFGARLPIQVRDFVSHLQIPFRDILLSFLCIPIRLICSFIPKRKDLWVFGSWMGKNFTDNPRFFYEYLDSNQKQIKKIVIVQDPKVLQSLRTQGLQAYSQYSVQGLWYSARAYYLFVTHSVNTDINICTTSVRQQVVHFWHGSPGKKLTSLGFLQKVKVPGLVQFYNFCAAISSIAGARTSFVIVSSKFSQEKLAEFMHVEKQKVKILGNPRNDILFKEVSNKEKIILYLPTYRNKVEEQSPLLSQLDRVNMQLKKSKMHLVIKTHPAVENSLQLTSYSNIHEFKSYFDFDDAQLGMAHADVLLTDYSGILYDFALTNRPIIFFPYDYDSYSIHPGLAIDYYSVLPGPFAHTVDELLEIIHSIDTWSYSKDYQEKYVQFKTTFNFYTDGESSQRLYKFLTTNL